MKKITKAAHVIALAVFMLTGTAFVGATVSPAFAAGSEEDPKAPKPEFEYIELKPLILPVITESGLTQQVSMVVSIEVPYGQKDALKPYEPRLADAYLQDLYGALGTGHAMLRGGVIDVMAVKGRLTSVTEKVIGKEKFNSVLLQVVQQRPM